MADTNITTTIKSGSLSTCIKALATAFKTASGLNYSTPATDEYLFSLGNGLAIKVKAYSTSAAGIYAVSIAGAETHLANGSINADSVFIYNKSASGKVLAFGYHPQSASNKYMGSMIATDTGGNVRIMYLRSGALDIIDSTKTSIVSAMISAPTSSSFEFITMAKLGALISRDTYEELYQVTAAPSATYSATDASVYSGGKLYKVISNNTIVICMKV